MSIEKTKLNYLCKGKFDEEQVMVECLLNVPDMEKLLWVEGEASIESVTQQAKEASFSGQVHIFGAYLDTEKKIRPYQTMQPFMGKISNSLLEENANINLVANARSVDFVERSGKLECLIGINGDFVLQNQTEILCGGDDRVCVKTEEITSQELIKAETLVFNEEITYPINDKMENILQVNSKVCIKSIIPEENLFSVTGEIYTTIKYITTNEELETVSCVSFSEPFKREIEVMGLDANGVVRAIAGVDRTMYKYELDKEVNKILITVPIKLAYRAYQELSLPYAVDVFGMDSNLLVTTNSLEKSTAFSPEFFEVKVEGSVQIGSEAPRIDKVVGFSEPTHTITTIDYSSGKAYIEGLVSFNISYLNDELENIETTKEEMPFRVSVNTEKPLNNLLFVKSEIVDVDIASRRGREVFFDGKLKLEVCTKKDVCDAVITELELKEPLPPKNHAIEIYFGKKGDDLWEIAKELKINPSVITEQNPDLVLPLEQSENIVIYNSKSK